MTTGQMKMGACLSHRETTIGHIFVHYCADPDAVNAYGFEPLPKDTGCVGGEIKDPETCCSDCSRYKGIELP